MPAAVPQSAPTVGSAPAAAAPEAAAPTTTPTATVTEKKRFFTQVDMGSPQILEGTYLPGEVRSQLVSAKSNIEQCYRAEVENKPDLAGSLDLRIYINLDGTAGTGVRGGSMPSNLISCVNRSVSALRFPRPQPTSVTARTTITLNARYY